LLIAAVVAVAAAGMILLMLPSGRRLFGDLRGLIRSSGPRQESRAQAVLLQER
jgi:hypothetical protein